MAGCQPVAGREAVGLLESLRYLHDFSKWQTTHFESLAFEMALLRLMRMNITLSSANRMCLPLTACSLSAPHAMQNVANVEHGVKILKTSD